ncbi:MAG: hypothetical protein H6613_20590 [Ignavibacteriales bacterium]|nr:hypothetical protein [Ignavibacteriales bacterium]
MKVFKKFKNGLYGNISVSKTKPFIFYPKINVQSDLRYRLDGSGTKIKRNLTDVFVILNESNKINNLPPLFNKISVQSDLNSSLQVNYEKLLKFLFSAEGSLVYNVEIGGSNIWEYHNLEGLIENLLSINIKSILLSSIQTFIDAQNEMIQSIFDQAMSLKLYFNIDTLYLFEKN